MSNISQITHNNAQLAITDLDKHDPFALVGGEFVLPDGLIYLDGNSLGPAPKAVFAEIEKTAHQEWAQDLIGSWNSAGWFELPSKLGAIIADIIGAGHTFNHIKIGWKTAPFSDNYIARRSQGKSSVHGFVYID